MINLFSKTYDFVKKILSKTYDFIENDKFF